MHVESQLRQVPQSRLCITTNPSNLNCALVQTHDHLILASSQVWITFKDRGEIRNRNRHPPSTLYIVLLTALPELLSPSPAYAMNLSSLVHVGIHQRGQQCAAYSPRPQQIMASSLVAKQYTPEERPRAAYAYVTAPQPPPSPPVDDASNCSLPSISSLLGGLPNDPGSQDEAQPQAQRQQGKCITFYASSKLITEATHPQKVEYRPSSSHLFNSSPPSSSRTTLPPTPPMQLDSGFDRRRSPSTASNSGYSVVSAPATYLNGSVSAMSSVDSLAHRQPVPAPARRVSLPAGQINYTQSSFNGSHYATNSMSSYYSNTIQSAVPNSQISGLYYQRPMPQVCPPPRFFIGALLTRLKHFPPETLITSAGANPWQHHHYISPSSAATFPQSQDRYICQTCNKAFSRPSSLRIHSHSHTGEKPFKCPQRGCGKAFSVRSNMKRHERGCHV